MLPWALVQSEFDSKLLWVLQKLFAWCFYLRFVIERGFKKEACRYDMTGLLLIVDCFNLEP